MRRPHATTMLRMAVGPLALAAFFLPWGHGFGMLSQAEFTGLSLVRFTGDVGDAGIGGIPGVLAISARGAALAFVVAATWHTILAPAWRWHPAYTATGVYLVVAAMAIFVTDAAIHGLSAPAPGALSALLAGSLFVAVEARLPSALLRCGAHRHRRPAPRALGRTLPREAQ
ncbi:MAG: hypothetical protein Kow0010_18600 [Dehalococcoidia bacterium]